MTAWDDPIFQALVNAADLVTPDRMPLVWALGRLGVAGATRVYGPTLSLHGCEAAARAGVPVGFYGGSREALAKLVPTLWERYPGLEVSYAEPPPPGLRPPRRTPPPSPRSSPQARGSSSSASAAPNKRPG